MGTSIALVRIDSKLIVSQENIWKGNLNTLIIINSQDEVPIMSFFSKPVDKKNRLAKPPAKLPIIVATPVAIPIVPANNQVLGNMALEYISLHKMIITLIKMINAIQNLN